MVSRPSLPEIYMEMAQTIARRSTCERKAVGCVVTTWDLTSVAAVGYNGNYTGGPNGCDRPGEQGNCGCVHAEANALIKVPYGLPLRLFCTASPCPMCAKMIANSSVRHVYFDQRYRLTEGLSILVATRIPWTNLGTD